jgi:hypothetical protein
VPYNNSLSQTNKHRLRYFVLALLLFIVSAPLLATTNSGLSIISATNDSSFSATLTSNGVVYLNWARTNEEIISHYTIEKSVDKTVILDLIVFFTGDLAMDPRSLEASAAGLQAGENTAMKTYKFKDAPTAKTSGVIYYRLKTVDKKGAISYSAWQTIDTNKK